MWLELGFSNGNRVYWRIVRRSLYEEFTFQGPPSCWPASSPKFRPGSRWSARAYITRLREFTALFVNVNVLFTNFAKVTEKPSFPIASVGFPRSSDKANPTKLSFICEYRHRCSKKWFMSNFLTSGRKEKHNPGDNRKWLVDSFFECFSSLVFLECIWNRTLMASRPFIINYNKASIPSWDFFKAFHSNLCFPGVCRKNFSISDFVFFK